jgi:imidazolonepropionase-like amidohydrolase
MRAAGWRAGSAGRAIVLSLALSASLPSAAGAAAEEEAAEAVGDLAAARALFEANLDAIRRRDRAAYLATYLDAGTLARTGPEGPSLGFAAHAAQAGDDAWPDLFEALDLRLVPVRPGVVYGTYRYRVRYGTDEQAGLSERLFVDAADGWRIAVTSAFNAPPGTPPPPRALVGATLLDGGGGAPRPDAVVILRGGLVDCAGTKAECPLPAGIAVSDLTGHWIVPGLVDAHVHLSRTGWADGRPDALDVRREFPYEEVQAGLRAGPERWFRSYLCSGVTSVFDVGGYPWTWALRERAERDTLAPHVAAAGPLLSTVDVPLNLPAERQFIHLTDAEAARTAVAYLKAHGASAAKVRFIPPADDGRFAEFASIVRAAGAAARGAGLPLVVHATGLREAKAALDAGARMLVHSVEDRPVDDEFIAMARRAGAIYCPTLTAGDGYVRMLEASASGAAPAIDDPNGCVDAETIRRIGLTPVPGAGTIDAASAARRAILAAERRRTMAGNLLRLHAAGIPIAMGSDAGNPLSLHGTAALAEMEAMEAAGMPPLAVLAAATGGGALALGRDDIGLIRAGRAADLLVVAADPALSVASLRRLRYVARGGVLRGIEELRVRR